MKHGDINAKFSLRGEPSRVFRLWRSTLQASTPIAAGVTILKRQPRLREGYASRAAFHEITRSERKLADMSLSTGANWLGADEIADTRKLHDLLWAWLSDLGPRTIPALEHEMPYMAVRVTFRGEAQPILDQLDALTDIEVLAQISLSPVYLQDRPRVAKARELGAISSRGEARAAFESAAVFQRELADGQHEELQSLFGRVERLFQKKAAGRVHLLQRLARGALGHRAASWLTTKDGLHPAPIDTVERYDYETHVRYLRHLISQAAQKSKPVELPARRAGRRLTA